MSQLRSAFSASKLRIVSLASIVCTAALLLSGCFQAVKDTYVITPDAPGLLYTIKVRYTNPIVGAWLSGCNTHYSGVCGLAVIRIIACTKLSGGERNICYAATDPSEADDFVGAAFKVTFGSEQCLALHFPSNVEGPYNWTARNVGSGGCVY